MAGADVKLYDALCRESVLRICPRKDEPICQAVHGKRLDQAIGELLVELMTPLNLEVSLNVQQELEERSEQTEKLRRKQVDRACYEADLARQRFVQVDPNNRLVAASVEAEWNEKLQLLAAAEEEFERRCAADCKSLDPEQKTKIQSLVSDFSELWSDPQTPARERKRMVRLLIEDVALKRDGKEVTAGVRFKAGATKTLTLTIPGSAAERSGLFSNLSASVSTVALGGTRSVERRAASSALAFWVASPRPILTTIFSSRGTCITFLYL